MRVFLAPGNHDWYGPDSVYARAGWAPHVTVFTEPVLRRYPLAEGFTLWGAAHCGPANTPGFFDRGFAADGQGVHIALFHGSEQGLLGFERGGKKPHAPFRSAQIAEAGLRYAFVGHFHRPRDEERLSYPGNPDPISFGDLSCSGAIVADVDRSGAITLQRHDVSVSEIHDLLLDITGCDTSQQARERMASLIEGLAGCARVTVAGEVNSTLDLRLEDLSGVAGRLEQIVVEIGSLRTGYDLTGLVSDPTVRGEFVRVVTQDPSLTDDERRRILVTGLRALDGRSDLEVA
jgi:DNA repair exonuclease SbcCD nuclease subunit